MKGDVFVHMDTLSKLYFDNSRFHNDIHREALDETYPLFSQPGQALSEQVQPEQESDTSARNGLTELQKKAIEIAKRYEKLPMEERLSVIAQAFGCTSGKIETSPCTGKWRGTSDISIRFDNGVSLFIGNRRTPQAKTARVQNEYINSALVSYNPEIVSLTKEAALPILRKREAIDNEIAAQKGLKPYTLLNVELNITPSEWNGGYLGWYYVTLAVEGKICTHMETDLYYDIADGKVSETPTRDRFYPAGALKDTDVDYVFNNVGFSSTSTLYSLPISDEVRGRAEKTLAERETQAGIGRSKAAEEEKSRLFVEHVMEDAEQLAEQEQSPIVRELYAHYKEILWGRLMEDEAFQNACLHSDRQNAMDEGHNAVERAAKDLGIAQGDMQFYKLYYGNTTFHNQLKEELANEGYDAYIAMSAELPPWGVEVGNHSPWGIVQTTQELADGVFKVSTPSHGGIMVRETPAKEYLPPELLARGGKENGWCFFEEDELAPKVIDELFLKGLVAEPAPKTSLPAPITPPSNPGEKRPGQTRPERNYRSFTRLFPEIADGSYHYLRMESGAGMGGMMPLHVEWISDDTVSISHTYTQNGDLMYDPEMTFLIDRDKGTMEAASYQQDPLGIYQNVYPEPGRWVPKLRKDLNSFTQQWLKNISEQNYVKREAIVVENGEDVTLEFDSEGALIQPKQLPDEPRDPLAPAYKVGDTVHLDDKEFTITEIGLHDVYLQSLTPAEQIPRSKDKTIFENLLRQDERNKYITDFFSADLEWSNGDLCEVLTSEYGFFSQEEKDEISSWLRSGETNSQISEKMREQFSYRSDSMELSDVRADHDSSWEGLTIFLVDPAPNEDEEYPKDIISASWEEITELVRAMYQQELGGFRHEPVPEHNTPQSTRYIVVSDEYGEKDRPFTIWDSWNRLHYAEVGDTVNSFGTREEAQTYDRRGLNASRRGDRWQAGQPLSGRWLDPGSQPFMHRWLPERLLHALCCGLAGGAGHGI